MSRRWWQSIRWRLALGSVLLALLTTSLLALTALVVINYYYGADQQARLDTFASDKALNISSIYYGQSVGKKNFSLAVKTAITTSTNTPTQQPTTIVLAKAGFLPIYPSLNGKRSARARTLDTRIHRPVSTEQRHHNVQQSSQASTAWNRDK